MKPEVHRNSENTTFFPPQNFSKKQLNWENYNILLKSSIWDSHALKIIQKCLKVPKKFFKISGEFLKKFYASSGCQVHQYACRVYIGQSLFRPGFWIFICLGWWYLTSGSFDSLLDKVRMVTWPWHPRDLAFTWLNL